MSFWQRLRLAWIAFRIEDLERKKMTTSRAISRLIQKELLLRTHHVK